MNKSKNWQRPGCNCCRHYCSECRQGVCSLHPYGRKVVKKNNTG